MIVMNNSLSQWTLSFNLISGCLFSFPGLVEKETQFVNFSKTEAQLYNWTVTIVRAENSLAAVQIIIAFSVPRGILGSHKLNERGLYGICGSACPHLVFCWRGQTDSSCRLADPNNPFSFYSFPIMLLCITYLLVRYLLSYNTGLWLITLVF